MSNFTGKNILQLLKLRAEYAAFKGWRIQDRVMFNAYVWLHSQWTIWFEAGFVNGALALRAIQKMEENNTAEYQCLQYHFCIKDENN